MRRVVLERIEEEERNRTRPLEDPYLVGEEAAARARAERMERERVSGEEILIREDRRWDWFLGEFFFSYTPSFWGIFLPAARRIVADK
jgi:hypothetical protein